MYVVSDIRDRSAALLANEQNGTTVRFIAGPPVEGALLAYANGEICAVEASDWEGFHLTARENCLIRELQSRELAAEVKLRLMEVYPEECQIWILNSGEAPVSLKLYELDRAIHYDHRTCVLIPAQRDITKLERYDFEHLNEILRMLCEPDGCPWDRAQTHQSLRTCILEEAYEAIDAIDDGNMDHLYDELGDVLMQISMHAEIARRHAEFNISDVTTAICEKLIKRHTHIFGKDRVDNSEQVLELWSRNKMAERNQETYTEVLRTVTRALPAMLRAVKILKRTAEVGLCDIHVMDPICRCIERLKTLAAANDNETVMGEVLMDLASVSRILGIDPEIALNAAINRFIERFENVECGIQQNGAGFQQMDKEILREYWDLVKL